MPQTPEGVTLKAHLTTALDEVRKGGSVELDNGQRWKFIDSPGAYYGGIAAGTEVTITTTMTNGYRMSIQGVPVPLKVKRTR